MASVRSGAIGYGIFLIPRFFFGLAQVFLDVIDDAADGFSPDLPFQFPVDLPKEDVLEFEGKAVFSDLYDLEVVRSGFDVAFVVGNGVDEVGFQFFDRFDGLDHQFEFNADFLDLSSGVVNDFTGKELGVGDEDYIIVLIEQGDFCEVDIDDLSLLIPDPDIIINHYFTREADDDAADDLSDIILGNDGNGGCDDTEGRKERFKIYAPKAQDGHQGSSYQYDVIDIVQSNDHVVGLADGDLFASAVEPYQNRHQYAGGEGENKEADSDISLVLIRAKPEIQLVVPGQEEQRKRYYFKEEKKDL